MKRFKTFRLDDELDGSGMDLYVSPARATGVDLQPMDDRSMITAARQEDEDHVWDAFKLIMWILIAVAMSFHVAGYLLWSRKLWLMAVGMSFVVAFVAAGFGIYAMIDVRKTRP